MAADGRGVALVTGASRGIGAAVALRAAKVGYAVLVNYSADAAGAASVMREIREGGGEALAHQAAISDPADVPTATVRRVMDVNVSGLIYVCQEALRRPGTGTGGPGGSIVNISLVHGQACRTGWNA